MSVGWLGGDILSWSGIVIDKNLNIVDKATFYSRPTSINYFDEGAVKIHGFNYLEALNNPEPRKTAIDILKFLKPFKTLHNSPLNWIEHSSDWIDWKFTLGLFLKQELQFSWYKVNSRDRRENTIYMGRKAGFEKNSLDVWAPRVDYKLDHHNSESDAYCTYLVYKYLKERL